MGEIEAFEGVRIRISESMWEDLRRQLLREDTEDEQFCFLYCTHAATENELIVYPTLIVPFEQGQHTSAGRTRVSAPVELLRRVYSDFAASEYSCLISCHSHPFSAQGLAFSGIDDRNDREQARWFRSHIESLRNTLDGSGERADYMHLVVGQNEVRARFLDLESDVFRDVESVTVVGFPVRRYVPPERGKDRGDGSQAQQSRHDRTVRAFGRQAVDRYSGLELGLVGAGGIGSIVAEGLARLGVRRVTIVDDDVVEESNLNRLQGAGPEDVGQSKARLAAERIRKHSGDGIEVQAIELSVSDSRALAALKTCDVLIGCVDNHVARWQLNRLSLQHLIAYIDGATRIKDAGSRVSVPTRVAVVVPGATACLECSAVHYFDEREIFAAFADRQVAAEVRAAGYIEEAPEEVSPAVYPQNLMVASMVLLELMNLCSAYKPLFWNVLTDYTTWGDTGEEGDTRRAAVPEARLARKPSKQACLGCDGYLAAGDTVALPQPYQEETQSRVSTAGENALEESEG